MDRDDTESMHEDSTGGRRSEIARRSPVVERGRSWLGATVEFARSLALVLVFFFFVRAFVVEAFKIPTSSMESTLLAGDFLLVNKAVYGADVPGLGLTLPAFATPTRGDIVVFHPPHDLTKHYVKRLIGMPGDTLQMRDKRLLVNGEELDEPYVLFEDPDGDQVHPAMRWQADHLTRRPLPGRYRPSRDNWGPLVVPPDHFFVLGDNRDNSEDSRYWGFVERENIKGRPWFVYYSMVPAGEGVLPWLHDVRWDRIGGMIR